MSLSMRVPIKAFEGLPKIQEPAESQQRGGLVRCRFPRAYRWERSGASRRSKSLESHSTGGRIRALSLFTRVPVGVPVDLA